MRNALSRILCKRVQKCGFELISSAGRHPVNNCVQTHKVAWCGAGLVLRIAEAGHASRIQTYLGNVIRVCFAQVAAAISNPEIRDALTLFSALRDRANT